VILNFGVNITQKMTVKKKCKISPTTSPPVDTLETQACDTHNSFDSQDNCVSALKNDGKYNYDAKQLDGCLPIAYNYVTDYITDIQPLYYTNDHCNNCLYSDCNRCNNLPWCGNCCPNCTTAPPGPPQPAPGPTTGPGPGTGPGPLGPPSPGPPSPGPGPLGPGPLIFKTSKKIPKLPEFPEFPKGVFTKPPKSPKILKSKSRIQKVPQSRIQKVPQSRIQKVPQSRIQKVPQSRIQKQQRINLPKKLGGHRRN